MIKAIYRIDDEGIYVDVYLANLKENTYYNGIGWLEIDFNYVEIKPAHAKTVKWNGSQWIVIEEYPKVEAEPRQPTTLERLEALESATLELILGGMG